MIDTKICNSYYTRDNIHIPETEDSYRAIINNAESLFVSIDDKLSEHNAKESTIFDLIQNVIKKIQYRNTNPEYSMLIERYKAAPTIILDFYRKMLDDIIKFSESVELKCSQIK